MKSDQTAAHIECCKKCGHVAEANQDFRLFTDAAIVEQRQESHRTESASGTYDRPYDRVVEHLHDKGRALRIGPGEITILEKNIFRHPHIEPGRFKQTDPAVKLLDIKRAGRSHHPNGIAGFQSTGDDRRIEIFSRSRVSISS